MLNFDPWLTNFTVLGFVLVVVLSYLFYNQLWNSNAIVKLPIWVWAGIFIISLAFMRFPFIAYNRELDIDESQMLAQAMTLKKYWIYWKYVDGTTQGPITSYLLIIPSLFGLPFDYISARLLGFILLIFTLGLTFSTFKNLFGKAVAIAAFAPIFGFYLLSQGSFSTLYNEFAVLFLLAVCFWLFSLYYANPDRKLLFLIGLFTGTIPFAKLQGVPTALVIVAFTSLLILLRDPRKGLSLVILAVGGILFPLAVTILTLRFDAFDYFREFYIMGNLEYSNDVTMFQKALNFPKFLKQSGQFLYLFIGYVIIILSVILVLVKSGHFKRSINLLFWFGLLQISAAFYAVIKSGYLFPHYLQFLIIPLGLLAGSLIRDLSSFTTARTLKYASFAWFIICILPHVIGKFRTVNHFASVGFITIHRDDLGLPIAKTEVSNLALKYGYPGEDMVVWGWNPAYHLETGLVQGTAENQIYRLLTPSKKQVQFQEKYLTDMKRTRPVIFIDQITERSNWFNKPSLYKHERFGNINHYIVENYNLVKTIDGERIYLRKDRFKKIVKSKFSF